MPYKYVSGNFHAGWQSTACKALQQPMVQGQLVRHSSSLWSNGSLQETPAAYDSFWGTPAAYGAITACDALQQPMVQRQLVRHSSSLWCNDSLWGTPAAYGAMTACDALQKPMVQRSFWGTPAAYGATTADEALLLPMVQWQLVMHSSSLWCNNSLWGTPAALWSKDSLWGTPAAYGATTACEAIHEHYMSDSFFFYTSCVSKRYNATWFFTWML